VYGRVAAVGLLSQIPAAVAASVLFSTGGYDLVGWASVVFCLGAAAVATRLPESRPPAGPGHGPDEPVEDTGTDETADEPGYVAVLVCGLIEAARSPAVGTAVAAVAIVGSLDGIEEYFSLFAHQWGIATSLVPLTVLAIPLVGAAGAAFGGSSTRLRPAILAIALCSAVVVMGGAMGLRRPEGVAGMALAYGLYRFVLVRTEAGLQQRIQGRARATVTSLAALGTDLAAVALYVAWASNRPVLVAGVALAAAAALPRLFRPRLPSDPA